MRVLARLGNLLRRGAPVVKNPEVALAQQGPMKRRISVDQLLGQIQAKRGESGTRSFMEMVPVEYRKTVIHVADKAFPEKRAGRDRGQFRENMALNWLAKKEMFEIMTREAGFTSVDHVFPSQPVAFLAFSISGSLIAVTGLDASAQRKVLYGRIEERESTTIPAFSRGQMRKTARINERLSAGDLHSSRIIALAINRTADEREIEKSYVELQGAYETINHQTIL